MWERDDCLYLFLNQTLGKEMLFQNINENVALKNAHIYFLLWTILLKSLFEKISEFLMIENVLSYDI